MSAVKRVANAMFYKKQEWVNITDDDKEVTFFIFNRYFSKIYPEKSDLLNFKTVDKVSSMNLWYHFMKYKKYPREFWSKSKNKKLLTNSEYKLLLHQLNINKKDLDYLISNHYELVKEELKHWKKYDKQ